MRKHVSFRLTQSIRDRLDLLVSMLQDRQGIDPIWRRTITKTDAVAAAVNHLFEHLAALAAEKELQADRARKRTKKHLQKKTGKAGAA